MHFIASDYFVFQCFLFVLISGANSLPQYLQLPIVDTQSCADSYARFSANSRTPIIINEKQLCAQGTANRDTCQGVKYRQKKKLSFAISSSLFSCFSQNPFICLK